MGDLSVARLTKEEKEWQARDDARVLSQAAEIRKDSIRHKKAISTAKLMLKEESSRLSSLRQISNTRIKPKSKS